MNQSLGAILTLAEVSEMLRTPEATLRYWRHVGTGPRSFKIGARVAYRLSDIEAYIDDQYAAANRTR